MPAPDSESRLPVGSSANRTVGRVISARAIATRCCWPPESSAGRWSRRSVEADARDQRVDRRPAGACAGDRQRQHDVLLRRQRRQQVERLEDEADVLAAQARELAVVHARDVLAGDVDRARAGRVEAGEQVHQRRLARARRAHDGGELAGREVERDAAQRVDGRVALAVRARQCGRGDGMRNCGSEECGHGERGPLRSRPRRARDARTPRPPGRRRTAGRSSPRRGGARKMPPDGRTDTDARTSLPPSTAASSYATSKPTGPSAASVSPRSEASWTSRSNPTRRPASRPLTRARVPVASRRPVELVDVEGHGRPAGGGIRVGEHVEHVLRDVRRWSSWRSMSSWPSLSRPERHLSSAAQTIRPAPHGRSRVILEDDSPIVSEDDDGGPVRG